MMEFDGFLIAEKQRHVEETCCWNHLNTVKKPSMLLHLNLKVLSSIILQSFELHYSLVPKERRAERVLWLHTGVVYWV